MNALNDLGQELVNVINELKEGKVNEEAIEDITSKIMVHNNYEKTSQAFQNNIELLDTWEIQQLTDHDFNSIQCYLEEWL